MGKNPLGAHAYQDNNIFVNLQQMRIISDLFLRGLCPLQASFDSLPRKTGD